MAKNNTVSEVNTNTQTPDVAALMVQLAAAKAENEKLKANQGVAAATGLRVTDKGGISVYGLGRFPVTLYPGQWVKLFGMVKTVMGFILTNADRLETLGKAHAEAVAKETGKAARDTSIDREAIKAFLA